MNLDRTFFLGIDTSAYTTSLALIDGRENLIWDQRKVLPVREGSRGLRQSEAVFEHIRNLPLLWKTEGLGREDLALGAVGASNRPRPIDGSYMPVFKVGEAFGKFLARAAGLFFLPTSHQEGHIQAALWSVGLSAGRYLVAHFSGGTTDLLLSEESSPGSFFLEKVGGGQDLHAGQFIDRIGQAMGLAFPAGPELEEMASLSGGDVPELPVAVKGPMISFSGPASMAERMLKQGCCRNNMARAVEKCVADSLIRAVTNLALDPNAYAGLLLVGGVAANAFIQRRLIRFLPAWRIYTADPALSTDNAVGVSVQTARRSLARLGSY